MATIMERLHWLGQSCFVVEGTPRIYFDPFDITATKSADIILVSHTHRDHYSPPDIKRIATNDTTIVVTADAKPDFPPTIITVGPGEKKVIKGVTIETVRAYNNEKPFHPKTNNWVGFIVTIDGEKIYHAGDTDFITEMKGLTADVGLLPIGGTYTMEAPEAAQAVKAMKLGTAVPMHWGKVVGSSDDADAFKRLVGDAAHVVILEKDA